jgi:hypothetical protein
MATTLALDDQHHRDMLKDGYLEIMSCPSVMDAVVATPGYINLKKNLAHPLYL